MVEEVKWPQPKVRKMEFERMHFGVHCQWCERECKRTLLLINLAFNEEMTIHFNVCKKGRTWKKSIYIFVYLTVIDIMFACSSICLNIIPYENAEGKGSHFVENVWMNVSVNHLFKFSWHFYPKTNNQHVSLSKIINYKTHLWNINTVEFYFLSA